MKKQDASTGQIVDDGAALADIANLLKVKVYSPFKVYYQDRAASVSAENDTGQFDVLVGHKNFLSLLNPCDIVIRNAEATETIAITRGIIHVHGNAVTIYLDV